MIPNQPSEVDSVISYPEEHDSLQVEHQMCRTGNDVLG